MESLSANSEVMTPPRGADFHDWIRKLRWIGHDDEAESLLRQKSPKERATYFWPVEVETD